MSVAKKIKVGRSILYGKFNWAEAGKCRFSIRLPIITRLIARQDETERVVVDLEAALDQAWFAISTFRVRNLICQWIERRVRLDEFRVEAGDLFGPSQF